VPMMMATLGSGSELLHSTMYIQVEDLGSTHGGGGRGALVVVVEIIRVLAWL
jgi:hypothetical protein